MWRFLKLTQFCDFYCLCAIWITVYFLELLCRKAAIGFPIGSIFLLETITHAVTGIGFWLFCIVSIGSREAVKTHYLTTRLESAFWVALMATLPDVDHFLSAGRLNLQAALNLPGRPFLHWCTAYVFLFIGLVASGRLPVRLLRIQWLQQMLIFGWILFVGSFSHILRDSRHRGLWFWPPPSVRTWCGPHSHKEYYVLTTVPLSLPAIYTIALLCIVPAFYWATTSYALSRENLAPITSLCIHNIKPDYEHGINGV